MKILKRLHFNTEFGTKTALFGMPESKEEISEMYSFRNEVYLKRGYIVATNNKSDIDKYDKENKCAYFVATIDNKIYGAVRMILDNPLPTEIYFMFDRPSQLKNIKNIEMGEISRLVIANTVEVGAPRNLLLLFLISCLVDHAIKNNIIAAYSFIKNSLVKKLSLLGTPVHKIDKYEQFYPNDGVLWKYFNDESDKVIPHYALTVEVKDYCDNLLNKESMFESADQDFMLKNSIYMKFLKKVGVI